MIWIALLALVTLLSWAAAWALKELVAVYKDLTLAFDCILNLQKRLDAAEQIIADHIGDL